MRNPHEFSGESILGETLKNEIMIKLCFIYLCYLGDELGGEFIKQNWKIQQTKQSERKIPTSFHDSLVNDEF